MTQRLRWISRDKPLKTGQRCTFCDVAQCSEYFVDVTPAQ